MTDQSTDNSTEKVPPNDPIRKFLSEEQDPAATRRAYEQVKQLLTKGEEILYIAVQKPLMVSLSPDCIVLTNKRFIIYRPQLLGGANFQDYIWRDLNDAHLQEGRMRSTFTLRTIEKKLLLRIGDLPKNQARKLYAFAQEREEEVREERRIREMEEKRAAAGGVFFQSGIPASQPAGQASQGSQEDPFEKLKKLKQMVEAGLITEQEYEAKKADILSQM